MELNQLLKAKSRQHARFLKLHNSLIILERTRILNVVNEVTDKQVILWLEDHIQNNRMLLAQCLVRQQELRILIQICLSLGTLKKPITGFSAN